MARVQTFDGGYGINDEDDGADGGSDGDDDDGDDDDGNDDAGHSENDCADEDDDEVRARRDLQFLIQ
eukprot:7461630-Pyramimonas_sp.AAC.1